VLLIVVERAAAEGVHVGVREYFRVGLPVTAATLVLACGSRSPRLQGVPYNLTGYRHSSRRLLRF